MDKFEDLMYKSGLTAQGCWDELDDYAKEAIILYGRLIVGECANIVNTLPEGYNDYRNQIEDAFRRECVMTLIYDFGMSGNKNE